MKYDHIALDLETLGTVPGSVVLSIGAVAFNLNKEIIYTNNNWFNSSISLESSIAAKLTVNPDTILWWINQSEVARNSLLQGQKHANTLQNVLFNFNTWIKHTCNSKEVKVWGYGSTFDNTLLRAAYEAVELIPAWEYKSDMCLRTLKSLVPANIYDHIEFEGTPHIAIDDAMHQAKIVQACLNHINFIERV